MRKHLIWYVVLWLPALLVASLYNNTGMPSQLLQWALGALFVLGWAVNTGLAAYRYPRTTLALLLFYLGVNLLVINLAYRAEYGTGAYRMLRDWGGAISYKPLDVLLMALLDFNIPHEVYLLGLIVALCLAGYLVGLYVRRVRPNPYRPRVLR